MTVYVDPLFEATPKTAQAQRHGRRWCHMLAGYRDDLDELHQMAARIGLKRQYFDAHPLHPHYDLTPSKRALAIAAGAVEVDRQQSLKLCSRMRCGCCPTALGEKEGFDPEAYDLLLLPDWVDQELEQGAELWCPWRDRWCVTYPVTLAKVQAAHRAGVKPDIKIEVILEDGNDEP